jgi:hypothetical protein
LLKKYRNLEDEELMKYVISDHCDVGLKSILRSIVNFYCIKIKTYFDMTKLELLYSGVCSKVHCEVFVQNELLKGQK